MNLLFTVADLIQITILIIISIQIVQTHKIFKADHERRKKQATFEFVNAVSDRFRGAIKEFDDKHGTDRVIDINDYDEDDKYIVKSYLNEIERICAGVNAGVFDYSILKKMMRDNLVLSNSRFQQYIYNARTKPGGSKLFYIEFDEVVRKFKSEESYNNIGVIKHS